MSDAALTNEQTLKLLHELGTNDGFRQRFCEKPAAALVEIGVPHETVVNLNAACLATTKLRDKGDFLAAHRDYVKANVIEAHSMIIPNRLKFDSTQ